jgi:predicted nucleic acid-binding protein
VATEDRSARRALQVQGELARRGQHRAVRLPDLLVAAIAELGGLVVLHYDRDFDRVAALTGQPCEWVVPPGTADL